MASLPSTAEAVIARAAFELRNADARPAGVPFWQMLYVHPVLDEENRPLGEHRAPRDLEGAAPTQLKQCVYAGSRHRHALPMNVSGLRQVSQHWDDIILGLAFLNHCCRESRAPLTLPQLWRLLAATAVLPAYLLHRARADRTVKRPEAFVAAIYKASLGIKFMLEQLLLEELLAGRSVHRYADAYALATLSESSGVLVGLEQVCAAPANMISDTLHALIEGDRSPAVASCTLAAIVGPVEPFRAFNRAACDLYSTLLVFATHGARLQGALEAELIGAAPAARESGPLLAGLSAEVRMSLTIGMRRICWPFARLEPPRGTPMLEAFCAIAAGRQPSAGAALLHALATPQAQSNRGMALRLESALAPHVRRRGKASLQRMCDLLAAYFQLERMVCAALVDVERDLNDALRRRPPSADTTPLPPGFCAVAPWKTAAGALGIDLASDPAAGIISCGGSRITVAGPFL